MAKQDNMNVINPSNVFWQCKVVIDTIDPDSGKTKKVTEIHLVDAVSPTAAEDKLKVQMEGTIFDYQIVSMQQTKIQFVY